MAGIPRLAWRNLGRNRRRTLTTGAALAFGISLCVASFGLVDGLNAELLDALTRLDLGHVQIHQRDYAERPKLEQVLPDADELLAQAREFPGVRAATARVYAFALVSAGTKSSGVEIVGVDPRHERGVTTLHEKLVQGGYLDAEPTPWQSGRKLTAAEQQADEALTAAAEEDALDEIDALTSLGGPDAADAGAPASAEPGAATEEPGREPGAAPSPGDAGVDPAMVAEPAPDGQPGPAAEPTAEERADRTRRLALAIAPPPDRPPRVFVGASLAKVLGVQASEQLYITAQTDDGLAESVFLEVAGIYETGSQLYDRHRLYMHLADAQRLVHLAGRPHEIAIAAADSKQAPLLAASLGQQLANPQVTVRAWNQIRPDIQQMLQLNSVSTGLMVFIIFVVATLGVVNTMLMAVFERTRELGVLKAIGMSGRKILGLIIMETLFLVLMSSAVGTALGLALDLYMVRYGVDLTWLTGGISIGGIGISPVLHGAITVEGVVLPTVILAATCFIASFYPALRAARMQPAVGMRET